VGALAMFGLGLRPRLAAGLGGAGALAGFRGAWVSSAVGLSSPAAAAGRASAMFDVTPSSAPHIRAGKLRALAVNVSPAVAGQYFLLARRLTLNQRVPGSSPGAPTKYRQKLER
jgi:hypothetical protein